MDKAKLNAIRKRIEKVKEPIEVFDKDGQLSKIIMPYSAFGHLEVEIVRSREQLHRNKEI